MSLVGGYKTASNTFVDDSATQIADGLTEEALQRIIDETDRRQDADEATHYRPENIQSEVAAVSGTTPDGWHLFINSGEAEHNNLVQVVGGAITKNYPPKKGDRIVIAGENEKRFDGLRWSSILASNNLPLVVRAGIAADIDLSVEISHDVTLFGNTYKAYPINFNNLLDATISRGNWGGEYYQAAVKESFIPYVSVNFAPHLEEVNPVSYLVIEESTDYSTWSVSQILAYCDRDGGFFNRSAIVDMAAGRYYRVAALLAFEPTAEDVILADGTQFNLGRNDQELIDSLTQANLILPAIVGDQTITAQNTNFVDIRYPITIQSLSAQPTQVVLNLYEAGNPTALNTETVTSGINPGITFNFDSPGIDGFNGATPKDFYVKAEIS